MTDIYDLRQERDEALVWAFTDEAQSLKDRYQEWITAEVKDLIIQSQSLAPQLTGILKDRTEAQIQRLTELQGLSAVACGNVRTRCQELRKGGWENLLEDHTYLQECLSQLHNIVRELYNLRSILDNLSE